MRGQMAASQSSSGGPQNSLVLTIIDYLNCKFLFHDIHPSCGWDLAEWLERLAVNAKVATVLGSIPAYFDTVKSEGRQMKQK